MSEHHHKQPSLTGRAKIAWIVFAAIAAFYLWTEHRAHWINILPFLLLLACPLMHLFMHSGHAHSDGADHRDHLPIKGDG